MIEHPYSSNIERQAPQRSPGVLTGRVPQGLELVVQLEQRNRAARHFERSHVRANQIARNGNPFALEEIIQLVVHYIQFDEWRAAQSIDESEHLVARFVRQVLHNHTRQRFDNVVRGCKLMRVRPGSP